MGDIDSGRGRFLNSPAFYGLRAVPMAIYILLAPAIHFLHWPTVLSVLLLLVCGLAVGRVNAYYEREFGKAKGRRPILPIIVFVVLAIFFLLLYFRTHQNVTAWIMAIWFLFEFVSSSGRFWHYLLPAVLFFALAVAPGHPYEDAYGWLFGLSMIAMGIWDHLIFVREMPKLKVA